MSEPGHATPNRDCGEITTAFQDSTILITGAAGLVGTQLLYRLLRDRSLNQGIKQVIAVIRACSLEDAVGRLPAAVRCFTKPNPGAATPDYSTGLVILAGDCAKPNFGLDGRQLEVAGRANIVINAAADTRFTLPLDIALGGVTDIAYIASRFTLTTPSVKTFIHLSTTFVGWFMKPGSTVYENAHPAQHTDGHGEHANTYLQAKAFGENTVNALLQLQFGQPHHGKAVRILRLATLGPAARFPCPGWGAGCHSSPVSAIIATARAPRESLEGWMPDDAVLDVTPIDIAVNQILALTAAAHRTHPLPTTDKNHLTNLDNPKNRYGMAVPCYHIASGLPIPDQLRVKTMNLERVKLSKPFIPVPKLLETYKPFISKILRFDTSRTRRVLGVASPALHSPKGDEFESPECNHTDGSSMHVSTGWTDPPIDCGDLDVDCATVIESRWGDLCGSGAVENAPGWIGYLECARDVMEGRGEEREWRVYVD